MGLEVSISLPMIFFFVAQNGVDFVQQFLIGNPLPEFHAEEQKMYDFVVFFCFLRKRFFR